LGFLTPENLYFCINFKQQWNLTLHWNLKFQVSRDFGIPNGIGPLRSAVSPPPRWVPAARQSAAGGRPLTFFKSTDKEERAGVQFPAFRTAFSGRQFYPACFYTGSAS
ncbi:MAG: hypothetical protein HFI52_14655, partial [Lachnospiraceae bacterium]|nr:hypothetical protein [Lachnospiraceae bacterium]